MPCLRIGQARVHRAAPPFGGSPALSINVYAPNSHGYRCADSRYMAATTAISTRYSGAARAAPTVARAGRLAGSTH